ncbi:hypothetical protein ONS95_012040 [Cadophora gregata]|uniref:uncharacterized protein n=1 Tax=Cadophora gregata TaxID=51156 RepID=UPI0026DD72B1|nr:uncharacterized protein ONS95_012040 [Cadophora gregata]KAK0117711.1 hypothetical protein ONS95_012040 [Cadophora gregata]
MEQMRDRTRGRGRAVRIAGASGSASDRRHAFASLAANHPSDPIDVIIGDWMSEANMTSLVLKSSSKSTQTGEVAYERTFLSSLSPALPDIARYGIKVAVNAGGSDTQGLFREVCKMVRKKGLESRVKVAWIEGDDVLRVVKEKLRDSENRKERDGKGSKWQRMRNVEIKEGRLKGWKVFDAWMEGADVGDEVRAFLDEEKGGEKEGSEEEGERGIEDFENLCTGEKLRDWAFKDDIIGAQAYLGGMGIAKAFTEGADIVICGRVSDASPVIGAAAWWHGWEADDFDVLAKAFVAGHMIECSTYVCGGNFSGFKDFEANGNGGWLDIGFPIAEIGEKGEVVITKQKGTGGVVSVDTCKAQLLYEIQGPWYFNSDVTAVLDEINFEQLSTDRVAVTGVKAQPPPPTTKIGITARGGFQAEVHYFLVGLDITTKAKMLERQIRHALGDTSRFHVLNFTLNGTAAENPSDQNAATVDFRVFAQARNIRDISTESFLRPVIDLIMSTYPGATFHLDIRQGFPKPVQEYYVALLPQSDIRQVVHMQDGKKHMIEPPRKTNVFPRQQPSEGLTAVAMRTCSETVRGPLGWLVHARSGDKGSNANVGFWVRHQDEYDWLRLLLSTDTMKELLAKEYNGKKIDRFELPNILAVHFLLHDHLDRGVSCSSTYDFLAKNVAEFLRSRYVDLPKRFLNRGKL